MDVWWKIAEYDDYKGKDGPGVWGNGVLTVLLERWNGFNAVVTRLLDLGHFVWRGQRQDWNLKSRFQREVTDNRRATVEKHTRAFERAIKGRRGTNAPPLTDDFALWSLGQHYGLPTPLLDWTESPFVAAYFACCEDPVEGEKPYRYVYGLSWDITRWGPSTSPEIPPTARYITFKDSPSEENARLLSQKGLFTVPLTADIEIEDRVQSCYASEDERRKNRQRIILVKIAIPETDRVWCLRDLNRMNINHATLFPDLTGAAIYCAMKLKMKDY